MYVRTYVTFVYIYLVTLHVVETSARFCLVKDVPSTAMAEMPASAAPVQAPDG